jgi:hypothetical protein
MVDGYGVDKVKGRERYVSLGVGIWKRTVNNDGREYRERDHDRCFGTLQSELLQLHVDHGGFLLVMSVISETQWGVWLVYIELMMFVKLVREAHFGFENILT